MNILLRIILVIAILAISACSGDNEENITPQIPDTDPVSELYNNALDKLQSRDWKGAKKGFEEVERQHPYSKWAKRAQILNAYANYENQDYEEAIAILERFVKLYPGDKRVAYAFYLIALSYYEQITDVGRDQAMTEKALNALNQVINRFPNSEYARDAKLKRDLVLDHLAGKEMEVGRYYLKRDEYLAAIKRFTKVIEKYQGTTHTAEALHRLVECYLKLGIRTEAMKYAAVLGHNFPDSKWYSASYKLLNQQNNASNDALASPQKDSQWWLESLF